MNEAGRVRRVGEPARPWAFAHFAAHFPGNLAARFGKAARRSRVADLARRAQRILRHYAGAHHPDTWSAQRAAAH